MNVTSSPLGRYQQRKKEEVSSMEIVHGVCCEQERQIRSKRKDICGKVCSEDTEAQQWDNGI